MRILIVLSFCAAIVFFAYQILMTDLFLATVGGYLSGAFLVALRTNFVDIKLSEDTSEEARKRRERLLRGHYPTDIAMLFLSAEMYAQTFIYTTTTLILIVGGLYLHRFIEIIEYVITFGTLAFIMLVVLLISIARQDPNKPP